MDRDWRRPVIADQFLESVGSTGHCRVIRGHDRALWESITDDPMEVKAPECPLTLDPLGVLSRHGAFIPIHPPEKDALSRSPVWEMDFGKIDCYLELGPDREPTGWPQAQRSE